MEILPLHIEYLLTRHDCVIVPGIGALIASEKAAALDAVRGVITPRRREISFNSSVVSDDGLLTHSIALREKLSYEEAHRLLDRLTEKMAEDLRNEGETSLGRVGKLVRDAEGLVSFCPRKTIIESDILRDVRLEAPKRAGMAAHSVSAPAATEAVGEEKGRATFRHMRTIEVPEDRIVFTIKRSVVRVAAQAAAAVMFILAVGLSILIPVERADEQKASVVPIKEFLHRPLVIDVKGTGCEDNDSTTSVKIDIPTPDSDCDKDRRQ